MAKKSTYKEFSSALLSSKEPVFGEHNYHLLIDPPRGQSRGLFKRDYGQHPLGKAWQGAGTFPSELMVPRSEWDERIKDAEAKKERLSDFINSVGLPCKDQNGTNYSHDGNTEVLTEKGWVKWSDYNWKDLLGTVNNFNGMMEFQAPTEGHAYEYDDEMYHSSNCRIDFGVTRNHRMLIRKWDESKRTLSNEYSFQRADKLGWYVGLMHAPKGWLGTDLVELEVPGDHRYDGDDFLALISLICSDGFAGGSESTKDLVSFCCFLESRYPMVAALAQRIGFQEQPSRKGVWNRRAPALAEWVRQNCYLDCRPRRAPYKKVPDIVRCASQRQINHFLQVFGDQSHSRDYNCSMFSSSKRMIDDLQELLLRVNKRGTLWKPQNYAPAQVEGGNLITPNGPIYSVGISYTERLCLDRKKHIETDHYKGLVYCATVPNGTLITRRNGTVLISGNCWINAPTHVAEINLIQQNQRMTDGSLPELSPASVGAKVKGFSNSGGWGQEGLDYAIEHGWVPSKLWPNNAISRQYDKAESWAEAAKYKPANWVDIEAGNFDQKASAHFHRLATGDGYDWWSHEVTGIEVVIVSASVRDLQRRHLVTLFKEMKKVKFVGLRLGKEDQDKKLEIAGSKYGARERNSWSMDYGEKGFFTLTESKATPTDCCCSTDMLPS